MQRQRRCSAKIRSRRTSKGSLPFLVVPEPRQRWWELDLPHKISGGGGRGAVHSHSVSVGMVQILLLVIGMLLLLL